MQSPPLVNIGSRRPYLYVGQLSQQINDMMLKDIFSSAGPVVSTKVVPDQRGMHQGGFNYGFVEYADVRSAESALQTLNGRKYFDTEIRVDWATGGNGHQHGGGDSLNGGGMMGTPSPGQADPHMAKENTANHFHVFVGDLSPEINDGTLRQAFQNFASISEARVMWDISSGKSRGYGFVAFRDKTDAEQAIATMNGEWLGSRTIRVNWANQKSVGSNSQSTGSAMQGGGASNRSMAVAAATLGGMGGLGLGAASSMPPTGGAASGTPITFEQAMAGSPPHNTTVYVGNIPPFATQNDLIPLFSHYGYIVEIRMQPERGFAFVKLDTHENAASAIVNLAGQVACGRPIKCGWGKDRNESAMLGALRQGMQLSGYANVGLPPAMYGMPQYGFPSGFTYPSQGTQAGGQQMTAPLDAATIQQMQVAQAQALQAQVQAQQAMQQQQQQHQQQQSLAFPQQQQSNPQQSLHLSSQGEYRLQSRS
jgi:nucleolysin TIA-1/TIAR